MKSKMCRCGGCTRKLQRRDFAPDELVMRRDKRRCRDCVELRALRECSKCHRPQPKAAYAANQLADGVRRVCLDCQHRNRNSTQKYKCAHCKTQKTMKAYAPSEWEKTHGKKMCKACAAKRKHAPKSTKRGRPQK